MAEPMKVPAPDAADDEWGRLAMRIPDWRWMRGMAVDSDYAQGIVTAVWTSDDSPDHVYVQYDEECPPINITTADDNWSRPDPDDPATAGAMLYLLGPYVRVWQDLDDDSWTVELGKTRASMYPTLGRACIALAAALGRWPGGAPC